MNAINTRFSPPSTSASTTTSAPTRVAQQLSPATSAGALGAPQGNTYTDYFQNQTQAPQNLNLNGAPPTAQQQQWDNNAAGVARGIQTGTVDPKQALQQSAQLVLSHPYKPGENPQLDGLVSGLALPPNATLKDVLTAGAKKVAEGNPLLTPLLAGAALAVGMPLDTKIKLNDNLNLHLGAQGADLGNVTAMVRFRGVTNPTPTSTLTTNLEAGVTNGVPSASGTVNFTDKTGGTVQQPDGTVNVVSNTTAVGGGISANPNTVTGNFNFSNNSTNTTFTPGSGSNPTGNTPGGTVQSNNTHIGVNGGATLNNNTGQVKFQVGAGLTVDNVQRSYTQVPPGTPGSVVVEGLGPVVIGNPIGGTSVNAEATLQGGTIPNANQINNAYGTNIPNWTGAVGVGGGVNFHSPGTTISVNGGVSVPVNPVPVAGQPQSPTGQVSVGVQGDGFSGQVYANTNGGGTFGVNVAAGGIAPGNFTGTITNNIPPPTIPVFTQPAAPDLGSQNLDTGSLTFDTGLIDTGSLQLDTGSLRLGTLNSSFSF